MRGFCFLFVQGADCAHAKACIQQQCTYLTLHAPVIAFLRGEYMYLPPDGYPARSVTPSGVGIEITSFPNLYPDLGERFINFMIREIHELPEQGDNFSCR